jgi:hypothetical protein
LSSREHIIGVTVSETSMETAIEVVSTKANSWKMRPTTPPMKRMGTKTAISERLMESTVKPTSCAPCREASMGGTPSSMRRVMFSITTMASSTTNPVEMVSAISDKLSRL